MMNRVYKFKTLLGHKNLDFSVECLNTFVKYSEDEIGLEIFDDGTLTRSDEDKIQGAIRNVSVITKTARDKVIREKLAAYPACSRYRDSSVYSYKLFDVMLYDESDLLFIDSDVYFLKRFRLPVLDKPSFIRDKHNAYSFTPGEFMNIDYPIYPRVNTGLFYFPFSSFDLPFLETLLSDPSILRGIKRISWLEQTAWAFLAGRTGGIQYFDPAQIMMSRMKLSVENDTIAVHLVSSYRYHFDYLKSLSITGREDDPSTVIRMLDETVRLKKHAFAIDRLRKGIYRRMGVFQ